MAGVLYVVSTPIGNREDLTPRAASVLADADVCFAEDTRRTGRLLAHLGIDATLRSLHAHNEAARVEEVLARLSGGEDCALVTDAGTPTVSDPGRRVVAAALEAGHHVAPVPGPTAVGAALSVSGLPADEFLFLGFPPRKGASRHEWLRRALDSSFTVVAYESPKRLARLLDDLVAGGAADRAAVVCRELTKLHEEVVRGTTQELRDRYEAEEARGEVTLVLEGRAGPPPGAPRAEVERAARKLAGAGASTRDIADRLRERFGLSRNEAYEVGLRADEASDG